MRKKLLITIPAVFLLVGLYCLIFSFSSDEGEKSSTKSHLVSQTCVEIVNRVTGRKWTQTVKAQLADYYEHPIRKLAHFSEYCLMGVLLFVIWSQWIPRNKVFTLMILSWVFLSAGLDEIHQLFVPDRAGRVTDVLIDSIGILIGISIFRKIYGATHSSEI